MAADSTMFLTMNLFTALSFGTNAPLDSQKTLLTCVRGDEKISIESVLLAFIGYKTSRRSRTSALPKPISFFFPSRVSFFAREKMQRATHPFTRPMKTISAIDSATKKYRFVEKRTCPLAPEGLFLPFARRFFGMMMIFLCEGRCSIQAPQN